MTRRSDDAGVAAVEFALLASILLSVVALVAPLGYLFFERVQLGRTAGDVVRFANSKPDNPRNGGAVPVNARPSDGQVAAEVDRAYTGLGSARLARRTSALDPFCPTTRRGTVTIETTVSLGPFLGLLTNDTTKTLTATATSCEE